MTTILSRLVAVLVIALLGCDAQRPRERDSVAKPPDRVHGQVSPEAPLKPRPLTKDAVARVRQTIEKDGGKLVCDDQGQPVVVDLAVGRGSASPAAFQAALTCQRLTTLRARADKIPASDLARIKTLPCLTELALQDADLTDDVLEELAGSLPKLQRLQLRNAFKVTDSAIAALAPLSKLTHLSLIDMQVTGAALQSIAHLPALVSLDVRMCGNIQADDLAALAEAALLKELKLGSQAIDDAALRMIAELPRLESLTVEDASIGAGGLAALANNGATADRLRSLSFARCAGLGDDELTSLTRFPNLRRLAIRDMPVTGSFLLALPTLEQLELLSLNQTFLIDEAFDAIGRCKNLKRLELAQNLLTRNALQKISQLGELQYLNLSECGLDDTLLEPIRKLTKLETLIVDGNPDVSGSAVQDLLEHR